MFVWCLLMSAICWFTVIWLIFNHQLNSMMEFSCLFSVCWCPLFADLLWFGLVFWVVGCFGWRSDCWWNTGVRQRGFRASSTSVTCSNYHWNPGPHSRAIQWVYRATLTLWLVINICDVCCCIYAELTVKKKMKNSWWSTISKSFALSRV